MTTRLSVVNDCLAIMGEAPLNALNEEHTFKQGALNLLDREDRNVQSNGWWFNMEDYTLRVNPADHRIYFPTDIGTVMPFNDRPHLVQRGRVLYDLSRGSDRFDDGQTFDARLVRLVPYEDIPESVAQYISGRTQLAFQNLYDGDGTKTRDLKLDVYGNPQLGTMGLRGYAVAEHMRNRRVNLVSSSERLSRVTNVINYSRRPR